MAELNLKRAIRIKIAAGELKSLKGPGFIWIKPEYRVNGVEAQNDDSN